jgi:hypothetical protein
MVHSLTVFAAIEPPALSWDLRIPLSILNFLEFAIWGAWFVVLGNYLNNLQFSRKHIGRIYATMSLGSVIAPMFVGTIADRYFASEQLMGGLHLVGGLLLYAMAQIKTARKFYWVALAYALVYSPTLALVNSVGFSHIPDPARDFPTIRVLGTIGWIAAGMSLRFLIAPGQPVNNKPLLLAAALSLLLGVYSFFLPHTPPAASGSGAQAEAILAHEELVGVKVTHHGSGYQTAPNLTVTGGGGTGAVVKAKLSDNQTIESIDVEQGGKGYTSAPSIDFPSPEIPFIKAIALLKEPSFAVFFGVSFLITLALAFYYSFTALFLENGLGVRPENVGPLMTIGQWVEIIFMFTLPWFLKELGMKWVLAIGMAAWGVRYAIFASRGPLPLILVGLGLHGICFDFFFAAGFIHVQNTAPPDIQASGQSLFAVLTYGLGMWLGTEASGWLNQWFTRETIDSHTGLTIKVTDWSKFWLVPCAGVVVSLVIFLLFFQ